MIAVDASEETKNNMLNYRTESMITDKKQSKFKQLLSFSALGNDSPTSSDAEEEYARQQKLRLEQLRINTTEKTKRILDLKAKIKALEESNHNTREQIKSKTEALSTFDEIQRAHEH